MKDRNGVSIFNYLLSLISSSFFNKKNFYRLLLCSSVPLLFGSPSVASVTEQQIAQVTTVGTINRPSLKVGSQGDAVSELQAALKLMGYYNGAVDGTYGQTTAAAVTEFKKSAGLAPDGIVDAATWQELFPGQNTTANNATEETSSASNTNSTRSKFPTPNQNAASLPKPVVVSNQESTTTTTTRRNTGNAQQLETVRTASTTRTTNTNNSRNNTSQQTTRVQQSTSTTSTNNNRGRNTATNTTNRTSVNNTNSTNNRRRDVATGASNNTSNRTRTRTSTSTSTYRTRQSDANLQKPGIQYTAAGFPILRLGMRGEEVYDLQTRLQRQGYLKNGPDGDFGADTETAVKALQQRFGLQPDGVAGGETWEILTGRRRTSRSES